MSVPGVVLRLKGVEEQQQMRYALIGLTLFATACSGLASTSPAAPTASSSQIGGRIAEAAATGASVLPFNGDLQATEAVDGSLHHLVGTGNGTHLGRFTYAATISVDASTGNGAGTVVWTAADGGQVRANTLGSIVDASESGITIRETQTITDGTGRFAAASGTIIVTRTLEFASGNTAGSYTGTLNLSH
jgi:hypothetical protein